MSLNDALAGLAVVPSTVNKWMPDMATLPVPLMASVAPEFTVTSVPLMLAPDPTTRVPPLTVVPPV